MEARQTEHTALCDSLALAVERQCGFAAYVCGVPGTGKTFTVNWTLKEFEPDVHKVFLNCMSYAPNIRSAADLVLGSIAREVAKANDTLVPSESYEEWLSHYFCERVGLDECEPPAAKRWKAQRTTPLWAVVLDELEYFVSPSMSASTLRKGAKPKKHPPVYRAFEFLVDLATRSGSRLVLIAISNDPTLKNLFPPKSVAAVRNVVFPAYTPEQLKVVARYHLSALGGDVEIDETALEFLARRAANSGGDARRLVEFIEESVERSQPSVGSDTSESDSQSSGHSTVSLQTAACVVGDSMSGKLKLLQTLPNETKIVALAVISAIRKTKNAHASVTEISGAFTSICSAAKLPMQGGMVAIQSHVEALGERGLTHVSRTARKDIKAVKPQYDSGDLERAWRGLTEMPVLMSLVFRSFGERSA